MEINCLVCFQLIPKQDPDPVIDEPSNDNYHYNLYLSKLFNLNLPAFDSLFGFGNVNSLSTSFCSSCSDNIRTITIKLQKLEELELEIKELKAQFEKNLIFGHRMSREQNLRMDINNSSSSTRRDFDFRAQLIADLGLVIKFEGIEEITSPNFCDFDQDIIQQNLEQNATFDLMSLPGPVHVPSGAELHDKVLIISLQKLNLPTGRISFNLSELKLEENENKYSFKIPKKSIKTKKRHFRFSRRKKWELNQEDFLSCSYDGCQFRTRYQTTLDSHVDRIHLKSYKCKICSNFSSNRREEVVKHEKKEHPTSLVKRFTCEHCGHRSLTSYELKSHLSTHDESTKIFKCETCFKGFPTKNRLTTHQKRHQEFNCPCPVCGVSVWKNELIFKIHVKTHQENLKCSICKEIFKTITGLKYHILRCEKKFQYKCSQCPKEYVSRNELRTHIKRSHEMDMPYKCTFCQKPYKYKDYLNVHIRTVHTGEKPYQCTICENSYASRHSFKIHKLTHNKNPEGLTHFCNFCGKKFSSNGYLQQHLTKTSQCQAKEKERIAQQAAVIGS